MGRNYIFLNVVLNNRIKVNTPFFIHPYAKISEYQMPNDEKSLNDQKKCTLNRKDNYFFLKNTIQFYNKVNFNV